MTSRNYRVLALSDRNTVIVEHPAYGTTSDTGLKPSEFGEWGLTPREVKILRSGKTRSGRDRNPR